MPTIFGTNKDEGTIFVPLLPFIINGTHFPPTSDDIEKGVEQLLDMYNSNKTKEIAPQVPVDLLPSLLLLPPSQISVCCLLHPWTR